MKETNLPFCALITGYSKPLGVAEELSRPRGRPKKRTSDHYRHLHDEHQAIADWYESVTGRPAKSDRELLTAYLSASLEVQNMRASRITSREFKGRLKTLRNEFSTARRLFEVRPEKSPFFGTAKNLQTTMQQRTSTTKEAL